MENKEKSVFERLEQQDTKLNSILDILSQQEKKENEIKNSNSQITIGEFVRNSKKKYLWFGSKKDFDKDKLVFMVLNCLMIVFGLISTICSSIYFKVYSTFTFFENIWMILSIYQLLKVVKYKQVMQDNVIKKHSMYNYVLNKYGAWVNTNIEKKKYMVFRKLSYFAIIFNVICILFIKNGSLSIAAIIFEVILFVLTILTHIKYDDFIGMYDFVVIYIGEIDFNQNLSIVYFIRLNKYISVDEFQKKYHFEIEKKSLE